MSEITEGYEVEVLALPVDRLKYALDDLRRALNLRDNQPLPSHIWHARTVSHSRGQGGELFCSTATSRQKAIESWLENARTKKVYWHDSVLGDDIHVVEVVFVDEGTTPEKSGKREVHVLKREDAACVR